MNRNEFMQALKAGKVSGAYLFEGVEENIKSVTLAALRKAVLADGLAELNESIMENPSAGEIIAACETLPFASDKRLGYNLKTVALLDKGNIQGLVVPDGYEIGYKSVKEIAGKIEHKFYKMKGYTTEYQIFSKKDFSMDDDLERFLYSYE